MSTMIRIPPGADVRLSVLPPCVIIAPAGSEASLAGLTTPGGVSAILTHEAGITWPQRSGQLLADEILRAGGTVCFEFENLADAFACRARLLREAAQ